MTSLPAPIKTFLAALAERDASLAPQLEPGGEQAGNWWIDLPGKKRVTIEWRPQLGFGFSAGHSEGYGEGPAEIFRSPERAAHRVMQLLALDSASPATGLRAIRELYDVTQDEIATRLRKGQAAISRLETRNDSKIETMSKFVQALGGTMEIRAVFPDGHLPIYQSVKPGPREARGSVKVRRVARV